MSNKLLKKEGKILKYGFLESLNKNLFMIKQIDFGIQIDFLVWRIQLKAIVNTLTCIILLLIWVLSVVTWLYKY